jgi:nucleoid DNA-binding protein
MDKPISLSVKDYLIRTLAPKMLTSEKVIDAVVTHQFSEANVAMKDNASVEISGFGKFYFNHKKALKKLDMLERLKVKMENEFAKDLVPEHKKKGAESKYSSLLLFIEYLKAKTNA